MQALELPLVESTNQQGVVYLLFPGFAEKSFQGVQYEIYPEDGLIYVFCYEEGFEESGDCEGVGYPVAVREEDINLIVEGSKIRIVDPEDLAAQDFEDETDYDRIRDSYESFRKRQSQ
ncbi:MAG: hypothetical protein ABEK50_01370 [bacterium]